MAFSVAALGVALLCALAGKQSLKRAFRRRRRPVAPVALLALVAATPCAWAGGEEPARPEEPEAEAEPAKTARLQVGGFVDAMYAYGFNRPADHVNFLPGLGTSAKRDNEATLNLAQVDLALEPAPVGFKLALGFGTAAEVVHAAEVGGTATSPDVWRNVLQASVQYQTQIGRGLLLEAGVYPSHIGLEAFATRDNWNYTRSWLCELSPFYQAGLKAAYPVSEHWSAQLHLVNGWQVIGDNNRGKSLGTQLAYANGALSVSLNGIAGPELAGNDDDLRVLGDVVAIYNASSGLGLGVCADLAREERADGRRRRLGWRGILCSASRRPTLALPLPPASSTTRTSTAPSRVLRRSSRR